MKLPKVICKWFNKLGYSNLGVVHSDGMFFLYWGFKNNDEKLLEFMEKDKNCFGTINPIFDRTWSRIFWNEDDIKGMKDENEFIEYFCKLLEDREFSTPEFFGNRTFFKFPKDMIELSIFDSIDVGE